MDGRSANRRVRRVVAKKCLLCVLMYFNIVAYFTVKFQGTIFYLGTTSDCKQWKSLHSRVVIPHVGCDPPGGPWRHCRWAVRGQLPEINKKVEIFHFVASKITNERIKQSHGIWFVSCDWRFGLVAEDFQIFNWSAGFVNLGMAGLVFREYIEYQ